MKHFQFLLLEDPGGGDEETTRETGEEELVMENKTMQLSLGSKERLTMNRSFKT